jgi:hypothetical protein
MTKIALITSTIEPDPGVFALKRARVEDRLEDYKKAFDFYCDCLGNGSLDKIVYVDNSGYPLDALKKIAADKNLLSHVEFISYKSRIPVGNNSRFFLEINLIQHFIENSAFLRAHPQCTVWKITGRYLIRNISGIIGKCHAKGPRDLYINFRNHPYPVVDFYLAGFSLKAYDKVFAPNLGLYEGPRDGELILREYLDDPKNLAGLTMLKRFPIVPRIIGVRGFDAGRYGGTKDSLKFYLRSAVNVLVPGLWL